MTSLEDRKQKGLVFNVQKYSVHDGPGIRTIVFFKGCPLRCRWCSNPESQVFKTELAFNENRCIGLLQCKRCIDVCPHDAISQVNDKPVFNREVCENCERFCVRACPCSGVIDYGKRQSVDEVLAIVEQDSMFYSRSGGGITLSGGEPLAQPEFAQALLREARRRRLNTAIETCGHAPWEILKAVAEQLDFILYDLKSLDTAKHKEFTGVSTELITKNLQRLIESFPALPIHVRTPIIPGFNDTPEDVEAISNLISGHGNVDYELLPYHRLGTQKYVFLNRKIPMGDVSLSNDLFQELMNVAKATFNNRQDTQDQKITIESNSH